MRARPLHLSGIPANSTTDAVGLLGCTALGIRPMPVQRQMFFLLEAKDPRGYPLHQQHAICVPRRSGKTDAILAVAIGRALTTPGFRALWCAQVGLRSRARYFDAIQMLALARTTGWSSYKARGEEAINFDNGSSIQFGPPKADNYRGGYFDLIVLDEAQEHDDEDAAALIGALLPTFDTRPSAMLVVSGTAGASRDGLLWTALEQGRVGHTGIMEYAAPDDLDVDDEANWLSVHPGPAGVSQERALEVLRMRHAQLDDDQWGREYMGRWAQPGASMVFPAALWTSLGVDVPPARPARYGLAWDVSPDGSKGSVSAAWRASDHVVWGGVLEDREGVDWIASYVAALAIRDRLPVWHDSTPWSNAVADQIAREHKQVRTHATTSVEYAKACASLAAAVQGASFRHSRQPSLDEAVSVASKRPITDGGWGWGRRASSGSIAPLVALSVALLAFDSLPASRITRVLSAQPA